MCFNWEIALYISAFRVNWLAVFFITALAEDKLLFAVLGVLNKPVLFTKISPAMVTIIMRVPAALNAFPLEIVS